MMRKDGKNLEGTNLDDMIEQWFSNFRIHPNCLGALLDRLLGPTPGESDSVGLW